MLPLINATSTDLTDLSSATPSASAFGLESAEVQGTFGAVMVSSMPDPVSPAITLVDEILPPGGNSLPAEKPQMNILPTDITSADISSTDIAPADGTALALDELVDETDAMGVKTPAQEGLIEPPDNAESGTVPVVHGFLNPGTRRLVEDLPPSGQIRERAQAPLTPDTVRILDSQTSHGNREQSISQQGDNPVRTTLPERHLAAESMDAARQAMNTTTDLRPLVDKFAGLAKSINVAGTQPSTVVTDSIPQLPGASQVSRIATPAAIQTGIDVPVLDDAWGDALNERVLWMAGKSVQRAEIRLNPADLGPIRIELSVADETAKVSFSAQNAITREAIESALPRLREMLSENGLSLANTDVSDTDGQQGQDVRDEDALHGPSAATEAVVDEGEVNAATVLRSGSSSALVDTFV